jgi:signal transduction histidine kinase
MLSERVADDIAPDDLARVFEPFVRGRHDRVRAQWGLGLGLALARRLAERHGGSLSAASGGPGLGSTFTLRLPVAVASPLAAS